MTDLNLALTSESLSYIIQEWLQVRFACQCWEVSWISEIFQTLNQQIIHQISHVGQKFFPFLGIHVRGPEKAGVKLETEPFQLFHRRNRLAPCDEESEAWQSPVPGAPVLPAVCICCWTLPGSWRTTACWHQPEAHPLQDRWTGSEQQLLESLQLWTVTTLSTHWSSHSKSNIGGFSSVMWISGTIIRSDTRSADRGEEWRLSLCVARQYQTAVYWVL